MEATRSDLVHPRSEEQYRGYRYDPRVMTEAEVEWFVSREGRVTGLPMALVVAHSQRAIDHLCRIRRDDRWMEQKVKRELILEKLDQIRKTLDKGNHPAYTRIRRSVMDTLAEIQELIETKPRATKKGTQLSLGAEESIEAKE